MRSKTKVAVLSKRFEYVLSTWNGRGGVGVIRLGRQGQVPD